MSKRSVVFICVVALWFTGGLQAADAKKATELPRGKIIRKVTTLGDPSQSYALYLPKSYTPAKKWPVLYAFSPSGRGVIPVSLFRAPAKRYGWIVVGSNNSRNGPSAPIIKAIKAMWKDTHARFSVDDERIYATGFSGGARVAFNFSKIMSKPVAAVMPCGAAFGWGGPPPKNASMVVAGMGGVNGFNYSEMLEMRKKLRQLNVRVKLLTFNGRHQWPPSSLCAKAARFVRLNDLLRRKNRDEKELTALIKEEIKDAEALLKTKDGLFTGYTYLKELAELLGERPEAKALQERVKELATEGRLKKEIAADKALRNVQPRAALRKGPDAFRKSVEAARKFIIEQAGTDAARRLEKTLAVLPSSLGRGGLSLMKRGDFRRALYYFKLAAVLAPRDPTLNYFTACAYAHTGNKSAAVTSLERLARFAGDKMNAKMVERLKKDPNLASLREDEGYKKLITELEQRVQKTRPDGKKKNN